MTKKVHAHSHAPLMPLSFASHPGKFLSCLSTRQIEPLMRSRLTVAPGVASPQRAPPVNLNDPVTAKHSRDVVRDSITLLTNSEIKAILRKKRPLPRQFPHSCCCPIPMKWSQSRISLDTRCQSFRIWWSKMGFEVEFAHDTTQCLREFSKSLTGKPTAGMTTWSQD